MAVQYSIRADVVDLTSDTPNGDDVFLVDSNVWYWTTYSRCGLSVQPPTQHQLRNYPQYLAKAFGAKAKLLRCGLSLAEIAHVIEKTEREIYNRATQQQLGTKEYRHNLPSERQSVVAEIQSVWSQIKSIAQPLDVLVDDVATISAVNAFSTHPLDGYDLFMIEAMRKAGVIRAITDDGDYAAVDGIQIFTCNKNLLNLAQQQGRLLIR